MSKGMSLTTAIILLFSIAVAIMVGVWWVGLGGGFISKPVIEVLGTPTIQSGTLYITLKNVGKSSCSATNIEVVIQGTSHTLTPEGGASQLGVGETVKFTATGITGLNPGSYDAVLRGDFGELAINVFVQP